MTSTLQARRLLASIRSWLAWLAAALCAGAAAQMPTPAPASLPVPVAEAMRAAALPTRANAIVVAPLDGGTLALRLNESVPMNPASTIKLVTTYAALRMLGPAYTWRTEAYLSGTLRAGVLDGDLIVRGSGDPQLVAESLWLLVQRIRAYGVREIRGQVVLDKSAFAPVPHDPAQFDGESLRPYNAGPDALLVNFKSVTFTFLPEPETRSARVVALPMLAGLKVPAQVAGAEGACGDWRARLAADFTDPLAPVFRGAYPLACGERNLHVSVLDHSAYFGALFRSLWEGAGGTWSGQLREGAVGADARRIAVHESAPLAEVVRDINKFSNNVMARQLFLSLGADASGPPATAQRAAEAVRAWLAVNGLAMPELVLENGSGLSRVERISAASLARLLEHAWAGPLMPELVASLPLVGVDGTMKKRSPAAGSAHIKTGSLADARSIAGYVQAVSGRRYVVVALINHPNAQAGQAVHDALLDWIYRNG